MSIHTDTRATARDLATVRTYCTRSASATVRLADALVRLSAAGMTVRAIADAVRDTDAPIGRTRIALVIRTRKANPDADADTFRAALADATAANTGRKPTADATTPTAPDAAATIAAALRTPLVDAEEEDTLDSLTTALAALVSRADAALWRDADIAAWRNALATAADAADAMVLATAVPATAAA